jgi:hypothetical protein
MSNLKDALSKYDHNSSIEDIIKGLQEGSYIYGLSTPDKPIFEKYLISLLDKKSTEDLKLAINALHRQIPITIGELRSTITRNTDTLSKTLDTLNTEIKHFSKSNDKASKSLIFWTIVMASATAILALATLIQIFTT